METIILALFALLIGVAFCFWGYRVFLVLLPIWGFFAGFWLGAEAITLLFGDGFLATTTGWIVGFIAGLILAVLSYLFYMVGVALVAGVVGWSLASGLLAAIGLDSGIIVFIISLITAIVVAGLVLFFNVQKYVIILLTALGGANAIVLSGLLLLGKVTTDMLAASGNPVKPILADSWFWLIAWLILAGLGFFFQIKNNPDYEFSKEYYVEGWG
jgi:Domain of unknown function (DUF4203)